jgi:hypothetical protein
MAWTFNNVRIFLQGRDGVNTLTIARLQPLSGGTILQGFGYESEMIKLTAFVVGDMDRDILKYMSQSFSAFELKEDSTFVGSYYVHSMSWSQTFSVAQTLRPDLACESPVYRVELELYVA